MAISEPMYGTDCEKILRTMVKKGEGSLFSLNISTVMEETEVLSLKFHRLKNIPE